MNQQLFLWGMATVAFIALIVFLKVRRHRRVQERKKIASRNGWHYHRGSDPSISYEIEGRSRKGNPWIYLMHRSEDAFAVDSSGEWSIWNLRRLTGTAVFIPLPANISDSRKEREKIALRVLHFMPGDLNRKLSRIELDEEDNFNHLIITFADSKETVDELLDSSMRSTIISWLEESARYMQPVILFKKDNLTLKTIQPVTTGPDIERIVELGESLAALRHEEDGVNQDQGDDEEGSFIVDETRPV